MFVLVVNLDKNRKNSTVQSRIFQEIANVLLTSYFGKINKNNKKEWKGYINTIFVPN